MKLFGVSNAKCFIASIDAYDMRCHAGMIVEGGQPGAADYVEDTKLIGTPGWAEVPQNFAELLTDCGKGGERKFGVWKLEGIKLLQPHEYPDINSWGRTLETSAWATYTEGRKSIEFILLKDAALDRLQTIYSMAEYHREVITYIINSRNKAQLQPSQKETAAEARIQIV